ncbi:MAG: hypothetical protein L7F78_24540 [Syntrophales bacterium LBB04]|nr:hypothetical protein [Syntrophales bacterium LBB04]
MHDTDRRARSSAHAGEKWNPIRYRRQRFVLLLMRVFRSDVLIAVFEHITEAGNELVE